MLRAAARSVCDRLRCSDKSICSGVVELISTIGRHTDYNMKGEHVTFVELSEDAVASQINCADTLSPSLHCTGQLSSRTISNVEPINYFERGPSLVVHVPHTHRPAWGGAARISDGRLGRTRRYSGKSMSAGVESSSPPKDKKDGLTFKISKAWLAKNLTNAGGILVAADSVATNLFRSISSTIVISKVGSVSGNGDGKTKEKAVKESASTLLIKCANGLEAIEKYGLHIAPDLTKPGEGVGAHCTEPQGQSRTNCLYHPRLQNVGSCAASTSFQVLRWPSSQRCPPGSVIRTVPAMTSRRYCTSAPTESQQATSDLNLCLVQYTSAINIFGSGPPLLVRVPNRYHDLYKLIKYNVKIQFLVTEFGKDASYSLIECVGLLHDNGLCLPRKLTLQDMLVSSLGTFSFPELQFVKFSPKGQRDDFDCVSDILTEMMVLRHGKGAANDLPPDYEKLLSDLKDRTVHIELLRWPPALLPATVYGLGLMKLHGLLMNNLLISNFAAAETISCRLSRTAQASPTHWLDIAQSNRFLKAWLPYRVYERTNAFHFMHLARNVNCGHPLDHRNTASGFLPKGSSPYTHEAVHLVFHHSYPNFITALLKELMNYYYRRGEPEFIHRLYFNRLFSGSRPFGLTHITRTCFKRLFSVKVNMLGSSDQS